MKTEVVDLSPTRKEIKIEIDANVVRASYERISEQYAKMANVPGFRRGHTPRSVVQTRFKNEIRGEVLREIVPQAVQDAIEEQKLVVLGEPDIHLDNTEALEKLGASPVSLHVHVEILPEVELGEYKGLEAARRLRPVTDADVDRVIEGLREQSASLEPVEDRGAEIGDTVTVNFTGKFVNEPEAEDINVEEVDVELGGPGVQQEFTDNLIGVRADETKTFTVNYPEDFTSKGLAGKEVSYTADVTAVRRKALPDVDDEWAKTLGEDLESLDALRARIREDLQSRSSFESENRLRSDVMRKLVEAHQFEVPETLVEHQTQHRLQTLMREMMGQGVDPRQTEINWEDVRAQMREQAADDVRGSMLLEHIAERENLAVTDEEIEEEINRIAAAQRQAPEQVRAALTKQGGTTSIADRLRNRKALDLLIENARVTDEEWREEEEEAPEQQEAGDEASSSAASEDETETKAESSSPGA
ncbi:MAG: trigger factor [Pyrinomonadaceae bacterium]|nr:trigger factor [Pyrinomonadaceae bacterium]